MELVEFAPDDAACLRDYVAVANAVRSADAPWGHSMTLRGASRDLRYGWDMEGSAGFLARSDGAAVGLAEHAVSEYDNLKLAWLTIKVHPDKRRCGYGSAILAAMLERTLAMGRTSVMVTGWDSPATLGFAAHHGLERRSSEINRRQVLAGLDRAALAVLREDVAGQAGEFELVRFSGPVPQEEIEAYAVMVSSINDAPTDDLDLEDEVITPARVRAYEQAQRLRGIRIHRVYARHRATGELAGQTIVGVDTERPQLGEQHDTSVVRAHRGHRLGLLLKLEMLAWLADSEPQLESIDTWNAESNGHMVAVNDALGYQPLGRELAFQRAV